MYDIRKKVKDSLAFDRKNDVERNDNGNKAGGKQ